MNENSLCPQGARGPHTFLYGMNKKNPIVEKRRKIILKIETTIEKKGAEDIERELHNNIGIRRGIYFLCVYS